MLWRGSILVIVFKVITLLAKTITQSNQEFLQTTQRRYSNPAMLKNWRQVVALIQQLRGCGRRHIKCLDTILPA